MNENFDLKSFKIQDKLNPNFWKNDELDSRIRLKLLDIADDFVDFLEVDWVEPEDITITGSIANYNWSKNYSDVDLHIIMNFKKVDKKTNFVKNYFDSKKDLWNQEHKDIKIYGFNIEVYVQDINEKHESSGVYSLEKNKWLIKPKHISDVSDNTLKSAEKNAEKWSEKITKIINRYYPDLTDSQKEKIITDVNTVIKDIKKERVKGFSNGGNEMNPNNITFKMLRRNGDIDKLYNKKREIYNDLMSINEGCWGYELFDNDDSLDKRDDFIKKTLKYLTNNLDKSDTEITGSGSEKFSYAGILYDFLIKNKEEGSYLNEYQQALKKCINFFEDYKTKKNLQTYSEPEKMKKTIEKTINELKKCISSN